MKDHRELILIIEDEKNIADFVETVLNSRNYKVIKAYTGKEALSAITSHCPDVILLDLGLPDMDGLDIIKQVREWAETPIVVISARTQEKEKVAALDLGADDYLVKPFAFEELIARIRTIFRRPQNLVAQTDLSYGDLCYRPGENVLTGPGGQCTLSKREGDLFELFIRNHGNTVPRDAIFSRVWGPGAPVEDGNLDNYIHFIRRRLTSVDSTVTLKTIRGVGYRLEYANV